MMRLPRHNRRPAFTLLELLILLPLLAFLMGLEMWGFQAQMSTHRRMAEQANRQSVMRSVLNQLRSDLSEADQVEFEVPDGGRSPNPSSTDAATEPAAPIMDSPDLDSARSSRWVLRIDGPRGTVRYRLHDFSQPPDNTGGGREWSVPQVLLREDGEGGTREWRLCGQTFVCLPEPWAPRHAIAVRFASRLIDLTGPESYRIFETTLLTGGFHDAAAR